MSKLVQIQLRSGIFSSNRTDSLIILKEWVEHGGISVYIINDIEDESLPIFLTHETLTEFVNLNIIRFSRNLNSFVMELV